jgi:hypothetical protein
MTRSTIMRSRGGDLDVVDFAKEALRPWAKAYESWRLGVADLLERNAPRSDCRQRCGCDDCHCRCCVVDSDLLIEARVGERRVIPVTIENHWRREREIEIELSSWTDAGAIKIQGKIESPTKFKLAPCADTQVMLIVEIYAPDKESSDVASCVVSYADLRIKGCDLRPIRVAVAILPRDCDDYVVDCVCGCC